MGTLLTSSREAGKGKRRWNLTAKEPDSLEEWIKREIYRAGLKTMLGEVEKLLRGLRMRWNDLDPGARIQQLRDIRSHLELLMYLEKERAEKAGECL
jgi:hypothetical protein